jgi:hypothetical protein
VLDVTREAFSSPGHLTQRIATPLIGSSNNRRFVYGWFSRARTDLGAGRLILPWLVPVEQTPRVRFDRSLAYGAVGLGRVIRHFTLTDFSPHDSITRWMRLSPVEFRASKGHHS